MPSYALEWYACRAPGAGTSREKQSAHSLCSLQVQHASTLAPHNDAALILGSELTIKRRHQDDTAYANVQW